MSLLPGDPPARTPPNRWWLVIQITLAVMILVPAALGFGTKFREFVLLYDSYQHRAQPQPLAAVAHPVGKPQHFTPEEIQDGGFALVPIMNYLLVSAGFFVIFIAALMRGMFHDIEKPKYDMLQQEEMLNALEAEGTTRVSPHSTGG